MANKKFEKMMEEARLRIEEEQKKTRAFFETIIADDQLLPRPLVPGEGMTEKGKAMLEEAKARVGKEQSGLTNFIKDINDDWLPTEKK